MRNAKKTETQLLATGRLWLGADGARPIGKTLLEVIEAAKQEIIIVAYRFTIAMPEFTKVVERALAKGCYLTIVLDKGSEKNDAEEIFFLSLLKNYKTLAIWDFKDISATPNSALHAKLVVVDRQVAVVGSANFSRNGMMENHEIAIKLLGRDASSIAGMVDKLIDAGFREGVLSQRRYDEAP